jgi:uncharacterized protein
MSLPNGSESTDAEKMARPLTTRPASRFDVIDALRGTAVLGVLVVNVTFMAAPILFLPPEQLEFGGFGSIDAFFSGLVAWLVTGKMIALLATLFGAGMGLIAARNLASGHLRRGLFVRRSLFLILLGLAHMILLFPGDILFAYGVTGLVAILFLRRSPKALLWWAGGLATLGFLILAVTSVAVQVVDPSELAVSFDSELASTTAAYDGRDYAGVIAANATMSAIAQTTGTVIGLTWILPLFLIGMAAAKAGIITNPSAHLALLRRTALVGIGVGLPVNLLLFSKGVIGASGLIPSDSGALIAVVDAGVTVFAVPLLSAGYASALALLWVRVRAPRPLVAVGRMALTAYLLQSLLAFGFFFGFATYGQVGFAASLLLVLAIWAVITAFCVLWLRRFSFGPMEWLWRVVTYLRVPNSSA